MNFLYILYILTTGVTPYNYITCTFAACRLRYGVNTNAHISLLVWIVCFHTLKSCFHISVKKKTGFFSGDGGGEIIIVSVLYVRTKHHLSVGYKNYKYSLCCTISHTWIGTLAKKQSANLFHIFWYARIDYYIFFARYLKLFKLIIASITISW